MRNLIAVFVLFVISNAAASVDYITEFENGKAVFELSENTGFEGYSYPRTLIGCDVDFGAAKIRADELEFIDTQTKYSVMFQLSDVELQEGFLKKAKVNFFTDLGAGSSKRFELRKRGSLVYQSQSSPYVVSSRYVGDFIELDTGIIKMALPGKMITLEDGVAGPLGYVETLSRMGSSIITSGKTNIISMQARELEAGSLFVKYMLDYRFDSGASYTAFVKVIAGYEHIEFEEIMTGIDEDDQVKMIMKWDRFNPAYRFSTDAEWFRKHDGSWQGIGEPLVTSWIEEDPHWSPGWREDPAREMVMRVLPYSGNGVRESAPYASFWEKSEDGGRELSVFVLDHLKWQDYEYKVWQPSQKLAITFRYTDDVLYWMWPLATGSRSTAIALTDAATGQAQVERLRDIYMPSYKKGYSSGGRFEVDTMRLRYAQLMHQRYGCMSLDRTKHWVLEYPDEKAEQKQVFDEGYVKTADEYEDMLFRSSFIYYPIGLNVWPGINSIQHRFVYGWATDGYNRLHNEFTPEQKKRINALWLMAAYINASEELHPIRTALAGCPNMAADGWSVPAQAAFLFPEHPMAEEWLDQYERYWEISSKMYTRPEVETYNSKGGRWTESLGVYNWAHLRPTGFSQFAGILADGKNRWANPWAANRGRWLVDMLSAPVYNPNPYWRQQYGSRRKEPAPLSEKWQPEMDYDPALGFERQYPSHGAHGTGTSIPVYPIVQIYGHYMRYYEPLLAEYMMWAGVSGRFEQGREHADWISLMQERYPQNNGTNPHLKSCKYTGNGIVLRSGVDTPQELSIHLEQVDRGPNYRWGNGGEGASGSIYFFAEGKPLSGHERESSGDRNLDATDGVTTFGVMKDHTYRSIGFNVLEKPLYDMGVAQFAELTSRRGESAYSWPEYKSRSIMLVGSDYWILCDENGTLGRTACRFSWFTAKDLDFPKLIFLEPETVRADHWSEIITPMSKGFHRDFTLENTVLSTVLVTHKDDVEMENMTARDIDYLDMTPVKEYRKSRGFDTPKGAWRVRTSHSRDIVFRSALDVNYSKDDGEFEGKAGVIRHFDDGRTEFAMFNSLKVTVPGLTVETSDPQTAISGVVEKGGRMEGEIVAINETVISFIGNAAGYQLYINSEKAATETIENGIALTLEPGEYQWQLVKDAPRPAKPVITDTEYLAEGVRLSYEKCAGASNYRVEISENGGSDWGAIGETTFDQFVFKPSKEGKYHIRVVAGNGKLFSEPADEWPVYVSQNPPHYPEGLTLSIQDDGVNLSWGKILGVVEYRLYRKKKVDNKFELIYKGKNNSFFDVEKAGLPGHYELPGIEANYDKPEVEIYEYAVSAVNGFGEGRKSYSISTDPSSWLNWSPPVELKFNRRTAYWDLPYVPRDQVPPQHYPQ